MDKLCHLESRMKDLFSSLKSELSCVRHELSKEIEKVKSTVNDMETSLNAAWETIKDLQDEIKIHVEFRKKHKESLEKHLEDNGVSQSAKAKIVLQESQINLLKYEAIRRTGKNHRTGKLLSPREPPFSCCPQSR